MEHELSVIDYKLLYRTKKERADIYIIPFRGFACYGSGFLKIELQSQSALNYKYIRKCGLTL